MKKKVIISTFSIISILICISIFVFAITDNETTLVDGLITQGEFNDKGHLSRDESVKTDEFSLMYDNKDGSKSLYVFTSPVNFLTNGKYQLIDNTLIDSKDGYSFENKNNDIHTYYPNMKEKDSFLLKHNDKSINMQAIHNKQEVKKIKDKTVFNTKQEMVEYYSEKNISVSYYTTNLGIKCQIVIDKPAPNIDFDFNVSSELMLDSSNQNYFVYKDVTNKTGAILYQPSAVDKDGNILSKFSKISLLSSEKDISKMNISLKPNSNKKQYPITVEFTLNMYKGNQVDSSIQSSMPNSNKYLDNYLYAGKDSVLGEAESYVRFESNIMDDYILNNNIKSIFYNCYGVSKKQKKLDIYNCDAHWTSTKITWNTRRVFNKKLKDMVSRVPHSYSTDVTELVHSWPNDKVKKDCGFLIRSNEEQFEAFASADNGYMMPRLEITFNKGGMI